MQEPHKKGVANHLGPESCARGRKVPGEALTDKGQPLSSEITPGYRLASFSASCTSFSISLSRAASPGELRCLWRIVPFGSRM